MPSLGARTEQTWETAIICDLDPAFLRAIVAHPDDDLPRLVAADWLDEHGQPSWAELIRVQCELALTPPCGHWVKRRSCDCCRLNSRESAALSGIGDDGRHFRLPSGPALCASKFNRGFPSGVACWFDVWLDHGEEVLEYYPIREVTMGMDYLIFRFIGDTSGRRSRTISHHLPTGRLHTVRLIDHEMWDSLAQALSAFGSVYYSLKRLEVKLPYEDDCRFPVLDHLRPLHQAGVEFNYPARYFSEFYRSPHLRHR
jgi:uncharacterized protein (TIGR02996 family)